MRLINFSVTNYRSITSARKIATSESTVLIGKNNEGKSNLLRSLQVAMETLQQHAMLEGRTRTILSAIRHGDGYLWERDFPIELQSKSGSKHTTFRLEFLLNDDEVAEFEEEIGSKLNGTLPLEIKIGKTNSPEIRVRKSGKNTKSLSAKSARIADFIANRIYFNYIPAVRTDRQALEVINRMLSQELRVLEREDEYIDALKVIRELQQPILNELADNLNEPLREFLPNIIGVRLEIADQAQRFGVRRDFNVIIDDGTPTNLEYKGDGVKSLVALGLLKNKRRQIGASIIAIEEPESHLHPGAIHQLREILAVLSRDNQIIITTHNPLFVDRKNIRSNVIISQGKATPAKNVKSIRQELGIKASDNLTNASYALVVEGEEDRIALGAILPILSAKIGRYLRNHMLVVEPIGGAGNLPYKLSLLKNALCVYHVLLDNDSSGRRAFESAEGDFLLDVANSTMVTCNGMVNSELEDCFHLDIYRDNVLEEFGVDLAVSRFRDNRKWSERVEDVFRQNGKHWSSTILSRVKYEVAKSVEKAPKNSLNPHKRNAIDALVNNLEKLLPD